MDATLKTPKDATEWLLQFKDMLAEMCEIL